MINNIILSHYFLKQNEKTLTSGLPGYDSTIYSTVLLNTFHHFLMHTFFGYFCNAHFLLLLVSCRSLINTATNCPGKLFQKSIDLHGQQVVLLLNPSIFLPFFSPRFIHPVHSSYRWTALIKWGDKETKAPPFRVLKGYHTLMPPPSSRSHSSSNSIISSHTRRMGMRCGQGRRL